MKRWGKELEKIGGKNMKILGKRGRKEKLGESTGNYWGKNKDFAKTYWGKNMGREERTLIMEINVERCGKEHGKMGGKKIER